TSTPQRQPPLLVTAPSLLSLSLNFCTISRDNRCQKNKGETGWAQ
ncbi:unnamed protein product, partial [Prunus brigantina]